jgi:hypothetical protein
MTGRRKNGESRRFAVAITVADADAEVPDDKRRPSLAVARPTGALRREQKGGVRRSTEDPGGTVQLLSCSIAAARFVWFAERPRLELERCLALLGVLGRQVSRWQGAVGTLDEREERRKRAPIDDVPNTRRLLRVSCSCRKVRLVRLFSFPVPS